MDITIYGRGGHGSAPQNTVDPIVIAARIILALQTIVARETNPLDPAVVTVGSIHGGTKHNIIPDEVKLQLTVRTYKDEVRKKILAAIERIAKAEAVAAGAPREPLVKISRGLRGDLQRPRADAADRPGPGGRLRPLARRRAAAGHGRRGLRRVRPGRPRSVADLLARRRRARRSSRRPTATSRGCPRLHSSEWAPDREPTLKTGAAALTVAALELLGKP